jgi:hypothetical protein
LELAGVQRPPIVVFEINDLHLGVDGARRFEVGRVIRADNHHVITRAEDRGGGAEQRGGGARRDRHVPSRQAAALGRDRLPEQWVAEVVAVAKQQAVHVDFQAEVAQPPVGHRAFR